MIHLHCISTRILWGGGGGGGGVIYILEWGLEKRYRGWARVFCHLKLSFPSFADKQNFMTDLQKTKKTPVMAKKKKKKNQVTYRASPVNTHPLDLYGKCWVWIKELV